MKQWWENFLKSHTITTHTLAVTVITLTTLYASVPAFHDLVVETYALTPAWFHKTATAALGIWAFYQGSSKTQ